MVSIDVPRNVSQRVGKIIRAQGRIVSADVGIYIVPVGKESRVTDMHLVVDTVGSSARVGLAIKRVSGVFSPISIQVGQTPPNNITTASAITLVEGERLTDIGNTGGKNATVDISATIEEFEAK